MISLARTPLDPDSLAPLDDAMAYLRAEGYLGDVSDGLPGAYIPDGPTAEDLALCLRRLRLMSPGDRTEALRVLGEVVSC